VVSIVSYAVQTVEIKDGRTPAENFVRDKILLKTSEQATWTRLRNISPVPAWNDPHPREAGFFLDDVTPTQKSRLVWELDAEYTPIKGNKLDADRTQRPAVITYSTSLIEQPTLFDREGRPTVNTAGQFVTGVMQRIPIVEYTVVKYLAADPRWLQTHLGAVNQDAMSIRGLRWAPKTLMLTAASGGEFITETKTSSTETQLTLMGDARTWSQEVWNLGTVELYETFDTIRGVTKSVWRQKPILRGDPPAPVDEPVPLDEDGYAVPDHLQQSRVDPVKPGRLIKLNFETQPVLPFANVLPLR
jgi:hypothetical protein